MGGEGRGRQRPAEAWYRHALHLVELHFPASLMFTLTLCLTALGAHCRLTKEKQAAETWSAATGRSSGCCRASQPGCAGRYRRQQSAAGGRHASQDTAEAVARHTGKREESMHVVYGTCRAADSLWCHRHAADSMSLPWAASVGAGPNLGERCVHTALDALKRNTPLSLMSYGAICRLHSPAAVHKPAEAPGTQLCTRPMSWQAQNLCCL